MRFRTLIAALAACAVIGPSTAAAYTATQVDSTAPANEMVGRFVQFKTGGESCSGAVVDAPNGSTVLTAAHCVNFHGQIEDQDGMDFNPGFVNDTAPFGFFKSIAILPAPQWGAAENFRYDYAFVVLGRNVITGKTIEETVGALPLAFNQPRGGAYRILGYPAGSPYTGQALWACDTSYIGDYDQDPGPGPLPIAADCNFTGGSSGGPWVAGGTVVSESSRGVSAMVGPYLDSDAAALFAQAGSIYPPPVPRYCTKKKKHGKHDRSASLAKKKKKKSCKKQQKKKRKG